MERNISAFLRLILISCMVLSGICELTAQTREITGNVVDQNNEPLIGVNVVVRKTVIGTVTDIDGHFKLNVPENTTLVISYIGYKTQEIQVGSLVNLSIVLEEDNWVDDHPFRINPYRRNDLHRIQTSMQPYLFLGNSEFPFRIDSNPMNSLEGMISGGRSLPVSGNSLQINQTFIRGLHSFASTGPLYIVDGVPIPGDPSGTLLSHLNTLDISSVYVLKDANQTAYYGVQGANGVVLIYTHDADLVRYEPIIRFSAKGGYTNVSSGTEASARNVFSQQYTASVFSGYPHLKNRWVPQVYASLDYLNTPSVVKGEGIERYSMRLNMDQALSDLVTYGVSSNASRLEINDCKETHVLVAPYLRLDFNEKLRFNSRGSMDYTHFSDELSPLYPIGKRTSWSLSNLVNYHNQGWSKSDWIHYSHFIVTGGHEIQYAYDHTLNSVPLYVAFRTRTLDISANYRLESYHGNRQTRWGSFGSVGTAYDFKQQFFHSSQMLYQLSLRTSYGSVGNIAPWLGDFWERTEKFNVGLQTIWSVPPFSGIIFSADYYRHITRDLLLPDTGAKAQYSLWSYVNGTQLRNRGVDLTLKTYLNHKEFHWGMEIIATHSIGEFNGYETGIGQQLLSAVPWVRYYINPDWYGSVISNLVKNRWQFRLQGNYSLGGSPLVSASNANNGNNSKAGNSFSIYSVRLSYDFGRYSNTRTVFIEGDDLHTFGKKQVYYQGNLPMGRSLIAGIRWEIL